jgi:L-ribulokinase
MENIVEQKMPGRFVSPGECAGGLCATVAKRLNLPEGTPVSAAIIDAHAGVPGAGAAEPDTLVMVMGTSSCMMLNSSIEKLVPGVAGVVRDGILPGYYGYETGQAAVGDAFEWMRRLLGAPNFTKLSEHAAALPVGANGVRCVDWFNGCRTPLMDGALTGALTGLTLNHRPEHVFRAVLEASACGLLWIIDTLQEGGVPVQRFVATGGLPHNSPLYMQICADLLAKPIEIPVTKQGPALGAAILGALAAGCFSNARDAIRSMTVTGQRRVISPNRRNSREYDSVYKDYRALTSIFPKS